MTSMAKQVTTKAILIRARALLKRGWCQRGYTAMIKNQVCFCPLGALLAALRELNLDAMLFWNAVASKAGFKQFRIIFEWNDKPYRTQAEVIAAFDRAIAGC